MGTVELELKKYGYSPRIRYEGVFNYGELLKKVRAWFSNRMYIFQENKYKHKMSDFGAEEEIKWTGEKKINEYVKYIITIEFHAWDLTDVEVVVAGKKIQTNKGRMLVEIDAKLEMDYEGQFEKSRFMENLRSFFHKYVIKPEIGSIYGDRLYYYAYKLYSLVKDFFDMETKYNAYVDMW